MKRPAIVLLCVFAGLLLGMGAAALQNQMAREAHVPPLEDSFRDRALERALQDDPPLFEVEPWAEPTPLPEEFFRQL